MPERRQFDLNDTEKAPDSAPQSTAAETGKRAPKTKFSGAYWYVRTDEETLAKNAAIRTLLTIIAFMLQAVILAMPQGGLEYVTLHISSYAFIYMWFVFIYIGVSIYVFVMNAVRYKFLKRIPIERAPKKGFKNRAFFGTELFMGINALMLAVELSFVCISYDGFGLASVFIAAAALAASVVARQYTVITLRDSELVPAPEGENANGDGGVDSQTQDR